MLLVVVVVVVVRIQGYQPNLLTCTGPDQSFMGPEYTGYGKKKHPLGVFRVKSRFTFELLMFNEERVTSFIKFLQRIPVRNLQKSFKKLQIVHSDFRNIFFQLSLLLTHLMDFRKKIIVGLLTNLWKNRSVIRLPFSIYSKNTDGVFFFCHTLYFYISPSVIFFKIQNHFIRILPYDHYQKIKKEHIRIEIHGKPGRLVINEENARRRVGIRYYENFQLNSRLVFNFVFQKGHQNYFPWLLVSSSSD